MELVQTYLSKWMTPTKTIQKYADQTECQVCIISNKFLTTSFIYEKIRLQEEKEYYRPMFMASNERNLEHAVPGRDLIALEVNVSYNQLNLNDDFIEIIRNPSESVQLEINNIKIENAYITETEINYSTHGTPSWTIFFKALNYQLVL